MNFFDAQQICISAHLGELINLEAKDNQHNSESWIIQTNQGRFYVKTYLKRYAPIVQTQITSLSAIEKTTTLACPRAIAQGTSAKFAWLVMSFLDLYEQGDQQALGVKLAALHRCTGQQFGWSEANFIGEGIQYNHPFDDWASFYRSQRLLPQLRRAAEKGLALSLIVDIEKQLEKIEKYFTTYQPEPNLLHGYLIRKNSRFLSDGSPILLNPSCSYGDREMDLAASALSGGFSSDFYTAYQAAYPLDQGYEQRIALYQLYYLLHAFNNHENSQNTHAIRQLLKAFY